MAASLCRRRDGQHRTLVQSAGAAPPRSHARAARAHGAYVAAVSGRGEPVLLVVEPRRDPATARARPRTEHGARRMSGGRRRLAHFGQTLLGRRYLSRYRFTTGNDVRLFTSGDPYFAALIERIDAAKHVVTLETYIFADDDAGHDVSDALLRAAQRGVCVRVITDGIGTARLQMFSEWIEAGIEHRIYNPHLFGRFGFSRTHRKLA